MEPRELVSATLPSLMQRVRIGYAVELAYEVESPAEFIFNLHAARTAQQRVAAESFVVTPQVPVTFEDEPANTNRLARLSAVPGPLGVRYAGTVEITQYLIDPALVTSTPLADLPAAVLRFLLPSRYCQVDQVQSIAWQQFGQMPPGYAQVDAVCLWVRERTKFQPGTSSVNTSALETLQHGAGVCRDFAHLTIALLRALNYPARFVTGVDYGADPGLGPPDFHAYVEVYLGDRWFLFDPTGISTVTGLLRIGTGRDAADVSFATMFGTVRAGMPRVSFAAGEDPAAGIAAPSPTTLAVSTAVE
ncbi:MAG: transglutaminase family protein, partial [Casimicrobiaceae bacterium]